MVAIVTVGLSSSGTPSRPAVPARPELTSDPDSPRPGSDRLAQHRATTRFCWRRSITERKRAAVSCREDELAIPRGGPSARHLIVPQRHPHGLSTGIGAVDFAALALRLVHGDGRGVVLELRHA